MKKNTRTGFMFTTLLVACMLFAGCTNQQTKTEQQNTQDSTNKQNPQGDHHGDGGTSWSETFIVHDAKGEPIAGALVSAPCTGQPDRTTDATGKAVFSGSAPCPCVSSVATITTNKGCYQKINITCDSSYTITCNQ